jgi:hypothetical protein
LIGRIMVLGLFALLQLALGFIYAVTEWVEH